MCECKNAIKENIKQLNIFRFVLAVDIHLQFLFPNNHVQYLWSNSDKLFNKTLILFKI